MERKPNNSAIDFIEPATEFTQDPFEAARQAFEDNQRAKFGLPPSEKVMVLVDSPDFSGPLPWDLVEGDDIIC